MGQRYFGKIDITPKEIYAGDSAEITIKLALGRDFSAENSRIIFDMPAYLGYSSPTCWNDETSGFVEVFCSNPDLKYLKRVWNVSASSFFSRNNQGYQDRAQRFFVLDFLGGNASEGDEILVKWGYTRDGFSVGTKVTTLVLLNEFYNTIHVRYFKDSAKGLPDFGHSFKGFSRPSPDIEVPVSFRLLPREPHKIRVIRKQKKACLLILDRFSNVCKVKNPGRFIKNRIKTKMNSAGVFEINNPGVKINSGKLPFFDTPDMANVYDGKNIYFGDLHTHSAFSVDCIEIDKQEMTPGMLFEYAKKVSCLDFLAVTDHHQPWDTERYKIGEKNWKILLEDAKTCNQEGEFLAFPGFEFMCERGDTAVVLNETLAYRQIDIPGIKNIKKLWKRLKGRDYITIPHFHNGGSLRKNEWYQCPYDGVEPNMEIYSCHGSYESDEVLERYGPEIKGLRDDRNYKYFLQKGYRYGITCNSDGHMGNPGMNGLTAVYAGKLTGKSIMESIRNRNVYGTTNARIRLLFTVNGKLMGAVIEGSDRNVISVNIKGEQPFKAVDIIRNGRLFRRYKPYKTDFKAELADGVDSNSNWYVRAIQIDNHIAYSSPVWIE